MSKLTFGNVIRASILVPCALYLIGSSCTSVDTTLYSLLLGAGVGAIMAAIYVTGIKKMTPVAVRFLLPIKDPQTRLLAAYLLALGIWLPTLFVPILPLALVQPFLPKGTSLGIAWLLGLALAWVCAKLFTCAPRRPSPEQPS
jgi:hypothetical protein